MKPGIQDEVEGKLHNLKGKVKEKVGELTNDPDLETEGRSGRDRRQGTGESRAGEESSREVETVLRLALAESVVGCVEMRCMAHSAGARRD